VRFGGCDLRCRWCDSTHTWRPAARCEIETARGSGKREQVANPLSLASVLVALERLELGRHRFVSLTGGEPLLQPEAAAALARALRGRGPRVLLETHGLAHEALASLVEAVDVVSMDWKLASDVRRAGARRGVGDFEADHVRFLRLARAAPEVVVKLVLTPASRDEEVEAACRAIATVSCGVPLVLQPVTPQGPVRERPDAARVLALAARAETWLDDVRVIPQTHPLYGAP
jgi:7-carboxy-7-deazaguanine synthase